MAEPVYITPIKKGYKTTEFWLSVAALLVLVAPALLDTVPDLVPQPYVGLAVALITAMYTWARSHAKANAVGEEAAVPPSPSPPVAPIVLLGLLWSGVVWAADPDLRYFRVTAGETSTTVAVTMDAKALEVDNAACVGDIFLNTTGTAATTGAKNIRIKAGGVKVFTAAAGESFTRLGVIRDTADCTVDLTFTK